MQNWLPYLKDFLKNSSIFGYSSPLMLCTPVFIFTSSSLALLGHLHCGSFDLTVSTCHIQYTFLSLCPPKKREKTDKTWKYSYDTKVAAGSYWVCEALILRKLLLKLEFCTLLQTVCFTGGLLALSCTHGQFCYTQLSSLRWEQWLFQSAHLL